MIMISPPLFIVHVQLRSHCDPDDDVDLRENRPHGPVPRENDRRDGRRGAHPKASPVTIHLLNDSSMLACPLAL